MVFTILLVLFVVPIIGIVEIREPDPSISVTFGEEIDDLETLLLSTEEYSPKPITTLVNDTPVQIGNPWRSWYTNSFNPSYFNHSILGRYLNIPLRNTTELIVSASFAIQKGPRHISIEILDCDDSAVSYAINSTRGSSGENVTLTLRVFPDVFSGYQRDFYIYQTIMIIGVEGDFRDGFDITSFCLRADLSASLYPVKIDIQRTNGESLYSYPTTTWIDSTSDFPKMKFSSGNFSYSQNIMFSHTNETFMLPSGSYTINFRWTTYWLNSSFFHSERALNIAWRIRTTGLQVIATQEIPGYAIQVDELPFGSDFGGLLIMNSLSFCLPPDRNYSVWVRGMTWGSYDRAYLDKRYNSNVTISIESNMVDLGIAVVSPGRLLMVIFSLLAISIICIGIWKYHMDSVRLVPFCLLLLSCILPWVSYTNLRYEPQSVLYYHYPVFCSDYPGIASTTFQTSQSTILVNPAYRILVLLIYLILLCAFLVTLPEVRGTMVGPKKTDFIFTFSICSILILEIIHILSTIEISGLNHYISILPGIGPFLTVLSMIAWVVLYRRNYVIKT